MSDSASWQADLPHVTPETPGIGGALKTRPEDFVVTELPLYDPSGAGEHVWLRLSRSGLSTRQVVGILSRVCGVNEAGVGYAGLKDKHAITEQSFTLHLMDDDPEELAARLGAETELTVLTATRHANKLKPGHLLGNRFQILVTDPAGGALELAQQTAELIRQRGMANFFGGQRFGQKGDNAAQGHELILGRGRAPKWLRKLLYSAYQSELFNRWLAARMTAGRFQTLLAGDVAKKTDTGGMFIVDDPAVEQPRLDSGAITYTGPLFGAKMKKAAAEAGQIEEELLAGEGIADGLFKKAGVSGDRRPARVLVPDLAVAPDPQGLRFSFSLPKGSYATVLLREFMKADPGPAEEDDGD